MSNPKPPPMPARPKIPGPPKLPSELSSKPPISRPLTRLPKRSSTFPSESPTRPISLQSRSAELVRDWAESLPEHKLTLERMARYYAALARRKRQASKGE